MDTVMSSNARTLENEVISLENEAVSLENEISSENEAVSLENEVIYIEKVVLPEKPFYCFVKRVFDFIFSLIALFILGLPMMMIAVLIRIDSPGPAIYKQERLGKDGKPFTLYKFRSMNEDAEKEGPVWAAKNDERVTRLGRFLRKSRVDELPQLFNIIAGHMSIVGPRPERAFFYRQFSSYIIGFEQRLQVIPGLTGWAQVKGGYNLRPEEKIVYDIEYMKSRSLWFDLKCIVKTVKIIFSHYGAR